MKQTTSETFLETPAGWLHLVAGERGLKRVVFVAEGAQLRVDSGRARIGEDREPVDLLRRATSQLTEYFEGTRTTFTVPVELQGTPFQREVWNFLTEIAFGQTTSYGEIASALGRPGAARAVGAANGQNPVGIIVPCHRVIGADGSLTGYAGGLEPKRWLLDHERPASATAQTSLLDLGR